MSTPPAASPDTQPDRRPPEPPPPAYYEDEVSLADLVRTLIRRKWVLLITWAAVVALAATYLMLVPESRRQFGILSIGVVASEGAGGSIEMVPIEDTATALARIKDAYLPAELAILSESGDKLGSSSLTVKNPKGTMLIVLEGFASTADEQHMQTLIRKVGKKLIAAHDAVAEATRERFAARLEKARARLAELRDDRLFEAQRAAARLTLENLKRERRGVRDARIVLERKIKALGARESLIRRELGRLAHELVQADASRKAAIGKGSDPTTAMALLLITSQIERMEERRQQLLTEREVELPKRLAELRKALEDNARRLSMLDEKIAKAELDLAALEAKRERDIEKQQAAVAEAEALVSAIRPTAWVQPPRPDPRYKKPQIVHILISAFVVGAFLGILAALTVQWVSTISGNRRSSAVTQHR